MTVNRYDGRCCKCGALVQAFAGTLTMRRGGNYRKTCWMLRCKRCVEADESEAANEVACARKCGL